MQENTVECTLCENWSHKCYSDVCGNLALVVDGFRCKRGGRTIIEADNWNLEMDGETYGIVKCFCYLGGTLDGDGGADLVATAIIRIGCIKFRELLPFLTSRAPPLEMKGQVYTSCDRSSMKHRKAYGDKSWRWKTGWKTKKDMVRKCGSGYGRIRDQQRRPR